MHRDQIGSRNESKADMHGETDQLVPVGNAELIAGRINGSQLVKLPRASHIFTTDQPEASRKAVMDFLARQAS